ncbi:MAG: DUF4011 domain-containing protein [Puniceicoccales bacterium]|jgi:very-short-patch-repair endonuclease|nr:DUF4011 domain-containing protein [Puniceicoccales bacterium]
MNTNTAGSAGAPALHFVCDSTLNHAFQQNNIPVIKEARLQNDGTPRRNLLLRANSEPPFVEPAEFRIEELAPHAVWTASPLPLRFNPSFLASLNERVRGRLTLTLHEQPLPLDGPMPHPDADGAREPALPAPSGPPLAVAAHDVALLAPNEWCGLAALPEILAAFVLPNDPAVESVLSNAAGILGESTGRAALNGYQEKSRSRVRAQTAAIFAALASLRIRYVCPPASFEDTGQKIRFPSGITATRLATCLDLALFAAACLEQAGLRPLVLIHEGHAYAAVWLEETALPDPVSDDLRQIRKLAEAGLLAVFECTTLTRDTPATLAEAELAARPNLETEIPFRLALDIHGARLARIRPLPSSVPGQGGPKPPPGTPPFSAPPPSGVGTPRPADPDTPPPPPGLPTPPPQAATPASPPAPARVAQWKSRLLDLSLRNRLLNFRETKTTPRLLVENSARVEDLLAAGKELALLPRPRLFDEKDPRTAAIPAAERESALAAHLRESLEKHRRLHTTFDDAAHRAGLTALFRSARLSLEENGANTLFAAAGILEWRETAHAERSLRAPLLLIPVELRRKSALDGFTLRRLDEETRVNSTLLEMLRQEFQKEIPGIDPLPEDDSGVDIQAVLKAFRDAVLPLKGWEVRDELWLGQFSFTKHLLWKDLSDRLDDLRKNRVVSTLLEHGQTDAPAKPPAPVPVTAARLDDEFSAAATICPRSADSSQLAAVMAAAAGHDFVLEGPPGTGKSQTITNIIAHCLAEGKRVLFVAEKRAALDVVHRRLREDNLAPFCLELHSNKSGKSEVLAQLREAINVATAGKDTAPGEWRRCAESLQRERDGLNAYVRALHNPAPCGISAHACFDHVLPRTAETARAPRLDSPEWARPAGVSSAQLAAARSLAQRIAETVARIAPLPGHPLTPLACDDYSPLWAEATLPLANALANAADALLAATSSLRNALGHPFPDASGTPPGTETPRAVDGAKTPGQPPALSREAVAFIGLDALLENAVPAGPAFFMEPWASTAACLEAAGALAAERDTLRARLRSLAFDEAKLADPGPEALSSEWESVRARWVGARLFHSWKFRRRLRAARLPSMNTTPSAKETSLAIEAAVRIEKIKQALRANSRTAALLGGLWNSAEPSLPDIERAIAWGAQLHSTLDTLEAAAAPAPDHAAHPGKAWRPALANALATPAARAAIKPLLAAHRDAASSHLESLKAFAGAACLRPDALSTFAAMPAAARSFAAGLSAAWPKIREWCAWQKIRAAAIAAGLQPLVSRVEKLGTPAGEIPALLEDAFHRQLLTALLDASPPLRAFLGGEHDGQVRRFRELDSQLERLAREFIHAKLAASAAAACAGDGADAALKAERALLNRELAKKIRHIPVRQLLAKTPNLLAALKPCVLMSPLSIAQYLEPSHRQFDIVIFDEASQIPVWDAIGAIARGRQAIIVGDPRQLPPTSFFNSATAAPDDDADDEDEAGGTEDLESILDELSASGLPSRRLAWHYRSRHESLIAFSNQRYYGNTLLTFPSADTSPAAGGIRLHHLPEARYDKSATRTNRVEAARLVAFLTQRLSDTSGPARSYGIVTFSLAQQRLVENLLDEALRANPALERHFGASPPVEGEPVFVKNLENVQGDERDVILFSIGYGLYDEKRPRAATRNASAPGGATTAPRVTTNFGPLNREGGERRLNVAITRAKHEIHVFSSITGDDLDAALTTTRARGVHDLRNFLAHAQAGSSARLNAPADAGPIAEKTSCGRLPLQAPVQPAGTGSIAGKTSPGTAHPSFTAYLAARIREAGFLVTENAGASSYRIDLAVADPAHPEKHILGVECDGRHYLDAATARDRDKLRAIVLNGLGWNLHRVWSPDWFADPDGTFAKLLAAIASTRTNA